MGKPPERRRAGGWRAPGVRRQAASSSWLEVAFRRSVVARSLRVALLVGTLLVAINHGDRVLAGTLTPADWVKMALTYLVPYGVATYAAVQALRERR